MSYQAIDGLIGQWAARHGLHVATKYQDAEVRSVDVVWSDGRGKCQIWIDVPDEQGRVDVNVWNYRNRRTRYRAEGGDLSDVLERAYSQAVQWLE